MAPPWNPLPAFHGRSNAFGGQHREMGERVLFGVRAHGHVIKIGTLATTLPSLSRSIIAEYQTLYIGPSALNNHRPLQARRGTPRRRPTQIAGHSRRGDRKATGGSGRSCRRRPLNAGRRRCRTPCRARCCCRREGMSTASPSARRRSPAAGITFSSRTRPAIRATKPKRDPGSPIVHAPDLCQRLPQGIGRDWGRGSAASWGPATTI